MDKILVNKIEILNWSNNKLIPEQVPKIQIFHRNYARLKPEEQKYVDSMITAIESYFNTRNQSIIKKEGLYTLLSEVEIYPFDEELKAKGTAGLCEGQTKLTIDVDKNPLENDIILHELIHLFIDIRGVLGTFFNEGLVDLISQNIANENGLTKVPSYHSNRALTSMLISVIGEDTILKLGTGSQVSYEFSDMFYELKIYGDSIYHYPEKEVDNLIVIMSTIGRIFQQIHANDNSQDKELARVKCIQEVHTFINKNIADVSDEDRNNLLDYFSNCIDFDKSLSDYPTNDRVTKK